MITDSHGASMVCDLEHCFLYELQHIPVFYNGHGVVAIEKYFWETELDYLIQEGKKLYEDEKVALLYAAICALEIIVEDMNNHRPRAVLACNGKIKPVKKDFVGLINDYKKTLKQMTEA